MKKLFVLIVVCMCGLASAQTFQAKSLKIGGFRLKATETLEFGPNTVTISKENVDLTYHIMDMPDLDTFILSHFNVGIIKVRIMDNPRKNKRRGKINGSHILIFDTYDINNNMIESFEYIADKIKEYE